MDLSSCRSILAATPLLLALTTSPALSGAITGVNGHQASGNATKTANRVELGADLVFDGGPDVYVAVKKADKLYLLGKLEANSGAQTYRLPSNGVAIGADEILLCCKQYNVTLGKASAN